MTCVVKMISDAKKEHSDYKYGLCYTDCTQAPLSLRQLCEKETDEFIFTLTFAYYSKIY